MSFQKTFPIFITLLLAACQPRWTPPPPGLISISESRQLVKHIETTIIDVRTPPEIERGAIDGAIHININDDDFEQQIANLDTAQTFLVYCKMGGRSARAGQIMKGMGFQKVYDLEGGYEKWTTTE